MRTKHAPAVNAVFLVTRGLAPRLVYRHAADLSGCGYGATLDWHGRWLLYWTSNEQGALIDATNRDAPIALTDLMKRLPGARNRDYGIDAAWAREGGRA